MGLCEIKGQKWSKRMIISTHRLEERPMHQAWMAAGPGWHEAVCDSGSPGSQQSSIYPCLCLHGQCWAPDSTCSEHFQLLPLFWFLIHTRIQVWYLMLVHEAPQEISLCSTIADARGFPTAKWNPLGFAMLWCCLEVSCSQEEQPLSTELLINVHPDPGTQLTAYPPVLYSLYWWGAWFHRGSAKDWTPWLNFLEWHWQFCWSHCVILVALLKP